MRHIGRVVCAGVLAAAALMAQPAVDSVLNPASYALPGLPNYGVAQGSLFVAFGRNLGPTGFNQVTAFPLTKTLSGISIKVTVGGTTVDCIPMNSYGASPSLATQVVGLLPSNTPVGTGTFVLTYNSQSSAPASIKVVANAFGVVAVNAGGSGPARVTDASYGDIFVTRAATNGQALVLWGTGLGATLRDETQPAVFRDMTELDVKVYVGGKLAQIGYRGRTPTAAGLDQINFTVPNDVLGCYVPLVVVVNGIASNWVTLSVAASNGACSDPGGLTAQEVDGARTRGSLRSGNINLSRSGMSMTVPGFGDLTISTDTGSASFERFDFGGLISSQGFGGYGFVGACVVYQYAGQNSQATDPVVPVYLDAGPAFNLNGPKGAKQMPLMAGMKGQYSATLGGGGIPGMGGGQPDYLDAPGTYSVTGTGGADVGPISSSLTLPAVFTWLNQASVSNVPRSQDLLVTWSGGTQGGVVTIMGVSSISTPLQAGVMFLCTAPVSAGQFTVPSVVLSALPVSEVQSGVPTGLLMLGTSTQPVRFTATGLDVGNYTASSTFGKTVAYQ